MELLEKRTIKTNVFKYHNWVNVIGYFPLLGLEIVVME